MDRIEEQVLDAIIRVLSVRREPASPDLQTPLMGGDLAVNEVEYVYIVMELMEIFNIRFDAKDFDDYALNSAEAFACCVKKHLER